MCASFTLERSAYLLFFFFVASCRTHREKRDLFVRADDSFRLSLLYYSDFSRIFPIFYEESRSIAKQCVS